MELVNERSREKVRTSREGPCQYFESEEEVAMGCDFEEVRD